MGSLLPGWHIMEESKKELMRKKSFTRDEIEHFWRMRNEDVNLNSDNLRSPSGRVRNEAVAVAIAGNPFPPTIDEDLTYEEKKATVKDWWTRTNHAFLNDPPTDNWNDVKSRTYVAQHDVANKGHHDEIQAN